MRFAKPLFLAFFVFILFSCEKEYSYEGGQLSSVAQPLGAIYSLVSSATACSDFIVEGNYKMGVPLTSSNKVIVQVNVEKTGTYSIVTSAVNGISFKAAGEFTTTGIQKVSLQGEGFPVREGENVFEVLAGSSKCSFTVTTEIDLFSINKSDSAWQFTQGAKIYSGYFDGAATHMLNDTFVLTLVGLTPTKDTAVAIIVNVSSSSSVLKTGTYKSPAGANFLLFNAAGTTLFTSENSMGEFAVVISKYDPTTQLVEGLFSGSVLNANKEQVSISQGKFRVVLTR